MNLDNQKLQAIKRQKAEIKKEMKECYDMRRLFQLDEAYNILDEDEKQILNNLGVETWLNTLTKK